MDDSIRQAIVTGVQAVEAFMFDAGWQPEPIEGHHAWRVQFGDDYPVVGCILEVQADRPVFTCHLFFEPAVPDHRRTEMALFAARANWGMDIGNFDLNLETGEVRYKTSLSFFGETLTRGLVGNLVMDAMNSANLYGVGFLEVIDSEMSARKAIALSEGASNLDEID